jgi:iron(II)-dependent oxidoreductase
VSTGPGFLTSALRQTRARSLALVADLQAEQWLGPKLDIVNPSLWELGHIGWFQEHWILRQSSGRAPLLANGDALYDSARVPHATRWSLPLPSPEDTRAYLERELAHSLEVIGGRPHDEELEYFALLALYHEDMHGEAMLYTRQTLGLPEPALERPTVAPAAGGAFPGDVAIAGGSFPLGAHADQGFVFDNEKWHHEVSVPPFALARAPVTEGEFLAFVEAGGYRRPELWSPAGRAWREQAGAEHPLYWRREGAGRWLQRRFDRWLPLRPHAAIVHVNWYEAEAWCNWAGRRLPTEAEWERAACGPAANVRQKRRWPWGDAPPDAGRAPLDASALACAEVGAYAAGDSAEGVRQLCGNVWEWTASTFAPFPGFSVDPYREYSEPWFGTRKVLRGGCFATPAHLPWNTMRNFFTPDRRDVFAGFRSAARERA